MISNTELIKRAEAIAERDGGHWSKHLDTARFEASQPPLEKVIRKPDPKVDALRKEAIVAQLRHLPGEGDPDVSRRIEIGDCETTSVGRVRVSVSGRDSISIHGVNVPLADIDADLRTAIFSTSAAFAAATRDEEQTTQRTIIGAIVDGVLHRHQFITAKVKENLRRERLDV
jgi:hypothetical protein